MPYKDPVKRAANHRRYMREVWYPANRQKQVDLVAARRQEITERLAAYKLDLGCVDCHYNTHAEALDFDHIWDKEFNVSDMVRLGYSWANILVEIEKCEVVCANCHRVRTAQRR